MALAASSLGAAPEARAQPGPPPTIPSPPTAGPRAPFHGNLDGGVHIAAYSADPPCPDEAAFARVLERLLGSAAGQGLRLDVHVGVVRSPSTSDFVLSIDVYRSGNRLQRALSGASCGTLIETAALITAITHDPSVVAARTTQAVPSSEGASSTEPPSVVDPPSPPTVAVQPPPRPDPSIGTQAGSQLHVAPPKVKKRGDGPELAFVQRVGPAMSLGDVPGVGAGFSLAMGLEVDAYRFEGGLEAVFASTTWDSSPEGASVDFTRVVGVLRACRWIVPWAPERGPGTLGDPRLGACAGVELGALEGKSTGVTNPAAGDALWFAPRFDVVGELKLVGPLSLNLGAGLAFPVDPRRYVLRTGSALEPLVVHEPGPVAGRAGLDVQLRW